MPTLYRKYRPQKFSDISGQKHIIQTITNQLKADSVSHAYLFSGPRGVGKTTIARLLAKAVNCDNKKEKTFEPCNVCSSCEEITNGNNIDVIEIDAASQTGVDNVRENIIENSRFKPTKSKYKVFIIDEVHMLSTPAFNALLKTLEEPPSHIIFILATTELAKIPATIISRCQRFNFTSVSYDLMFERLEKICKKEGVDVEKDVLKKIINKSDGCLRDAESLLGQVLTLDLKKITSKDALLVLPTSNTESLINFIQFISEKETKQAIDIIEQEKENGTNLEQFCHDLLEILRLIMMSQNGYEKFNSEYDDETLKKIKKLSLSFSTNTIINFIDLTLKRKREIRNAPMPSLPLELLAVELTLKETDENKKNEPTVQIEKRDTKIKEVETTKNDTAKTEEKTKEEKPSSTAFESIKKITKKLGKKEPLTTTIENVKEKWNELINNISETNHSLVFILKMCDLKKVTDEGLFLTAPFTLHCDKIMDHKNKIIIENNLEKIFSEKIIISCEVEAEKEKNDDKEIADLASEFGGEVMA